MMETKLVPETSENLHGFGTTKTPAHPADGDEVSSRNVENLHHFGTTKPPAHPDDGD